jgi:nucleoside-diphosphate-sugar epimerase
VRKLVTGAAGFIGSHLAERLLDEGHHVTGIDCFVPYYPRHIKQANLLDLCKNPRFEFLPLDLRSDDLAEALSTVDTVFHLAAMPGLTASWSEFETYMTCNLLATQRLLEAARNSPLTTFVHASTSSVYGKEATGNEDTPLNPISPYGATKLAAERLALAYHAEFKVPSIVLRYFSVYGPRQRPDMGYHTFISKVLNGEPVTVFGDGEQTRGNTYVDDCVEATLLAACRGKPGEVYNVGGGEARSVLWVLNTIEDITGERARIQHAPRRAGDQQHTIADISKMRRDFGYEPRTSLRDGLTAQIEWQCRQVPALSSASI